MESGRLLRKYCSVSMVIRSRLAISLMAAASRSARCKKARLIDHQGWIAQNPGESAEFLKGENIARFHIREDRQAAAVHTAGSVGLEREDARPDLLAFGVADEPGAVEELGEPIHRDVFGAGIVAQVGDGAGDNGFDIILLDPFLEGQAQQAAFLQGGEGDLAVGGDAVEAGLGHDFGLFGRFARQLQRCCRLIIEFGDGVGTELRHGAYDPGNPFDEIDGGLWEFERRSVG